MTRRRHYHPYHEYCTCKKSLRQAGATVAAWAFLVLLLLTSCAKMGQPDGGWFDETPPRVIGTHPSDKSVNVKGKRISIFFDEYIKLDNPQEKVVVSPPQLEWPDIKAQGKSISVVLKDSLRANTTYTIDFSDAISDNNEGNPLGNYTYSFSTGSAIDTLEVSGYVLEAENLEPVKGILVGLYDSAADSTFREKSMLRVSRTDSRGHFVIKGIAKGSYRIYALQDVDNNYKFSQKSEKIAFDSRIITPTSRADIRQDTIWQDSLRIKGIERVGYTRFMPDDIVLRAFTEVQTDRFLLKSARPDANRFELFFSAGDSLLPTIKGLNFNERDAFFIESSLRKDTITYWLRDSTLANQDTLRMEVGYRMTDSLGLLVSQTDTLELIPKVSYAKRMKDKAKEQEKWLKEQEKRKKRGEPYESEMPPKKLALDIHVPSNMDPDQNILIETATPIARADSHLLHLYAKKDTLWHVVPFEIRRISMRQYEMKAEWRPGIEYSLELDSTAFADIYGHVSGKYKQGMKVRGEDEYCSLFIEMDGMDGKQVVVQLLDRQDKAIKTTTTNNGTAEFYYLRPNKYYLRAFVDTNGNGRWDTGDYATGQQPEAVYYYPGEIECRAKWDLTERWNPTARILSAQKPMEITKQKPEKEKKIKFQNAERARRLGLEYPDSHGNNKTKKADDTNGKQS